MSIKEEVLLDLTATTHNQQAHTFDCGIGGTHLLNTTAIYGANASGKTTIVLALKVMQAMVRRSASSQRGVSLPIEPFVLDEVTKIEPSEFEVNFIIKDTHYNYGFSATREKIIKEWLYAYPEGKEEKEQVWFVRSIDSTGIESNYNEEQWRDLKKMTRNNALLLSVATQFDESLVKPIFDWFDEELRIIVDISRLRHLRHSFVFFGVILDDIPRNNTTQMCKDERDNALILEYLKVADFAIKKIEVEEERIEDSIWNFENRNTSSFTIDKPRFFHSNEHRQGFDLQQESAGTQRFLELLAPFIMALRRGHTLITDELNEKLHSRLVYFLWKMFQHERLNEKHAQLVVTTHDTSLLSLENLPTDCIWFCKKGRNGETSLFPLSDFEENPSLNLEKGYRSGRFGGVPFISDIDLMMDKLLGK